MIFLLRLPTYLLVITISIFIIVISFISVGLNFIVAACHTLLNYIGYKRGINGGNAMGIKEFFNMWRDAREFRKYVKELRRNKKS